MVGAAAICERGTRRSENQDACCVQVAETPAGMLSMAVVCDGVGGLAHGEVASSYVVQRMAAWFKGVVADTATSSDLGAPAQDPPLPDRLDVAWDELLHDAHERLAERGDREGAALGTTFTGVIAAGGRYLVAHVGDSRLYVLHNEEVSIVTEDQTVAAKLLAEGEIGEGEVESHPGRHVILQAVGAGNELRPLFAKGTYDACDLFVLCTDGVYDVLDASALLCCAAEVGFPNGTPELDLFCRRLVDLAQQAGSTDNLCVACFRGDPLRGSAPDTVVVGGARSW